MILSEPSNFHLTPGLLIRLPPRESAVLSEETDDGLRLYPRASLKPIKYHQQDTRNLPVKVRSGSGKVKSRSIHFSLYIIYIKIYKMYQKRMHEELW